MSNLKRIYVAFSAALAIAGVSTPALAVDAAQAYNLEVGLIHVQATGQFMIGAKNGIKRLDGTSATCSGGYIYFHQNAAGTAYNEQNKNRMLNLLTSAQLAARPVQIYITRNASDQCYADYVVML